DRGQRPLDDRRVSRVRPLVPLDREPSLRGRRHGRAIPDRNAAAGIGMRLGDLAAIIRSKNAGIGYFAIDVLFREAAAYEAARAVLTRESVAAAYGIAAADIVDLVAFDQGQAIKVVLPRSRVAGGRGLGETDMYGSGQYAPLLEIDVPE